MDDVLFSPAKWLLAMLRMLLSEWRTLRLLPVWLPLHHAGCFAKNPVFAVPFHVCERLIPRRFSFVSLIVFSLFSLLVDCIKITHYLKILKY